jgi:hypothetical protein
MNSKAKAMKYQNQEAIEKINSEIKELQNAINGSIEEAYAKHSIPENEALPSDILKKLNLNKEYIAESFISKPKFFFENLLKGWFFGLGKVIYTDEHKVKITQKAKSIVDDFSRNFLEKRQLILHKQRDEFIETVKEIINNNGKISEEAKSFVLDIRPPELARPYAPTDFSEIYDANKRVDEILWFDIEYIDKNNFIEECERKLLKLSTSMTIDFEKDFRDSLFSILSAVQSEFVQNLEKYSLLMKAKMEDKEAMQDLREKLFNAITELDSCKTELYKLIWGVKNNEQ